ncbi:N-acetylglucosamine-6-phosphate deacetylase [Gracilibacillus kekensis]|uniref:N-acetylglucosamine-6-phosphate deacetylase n=1 Tax=Gracilibacillus kekensis TaxID=1027249 RepID=A0A1M7QT71_9BACI|nr:N-acetylglucosamine-6-phosphate deacetylase [Gracilibacillus kekensis]SHN34574.1 N-acetylglucosamine 6-phosphate deacetylase [Gracilibacillus kekensis]
MDKQSILIKNIQIYAKDNHIDNGFIKIKNQQIEDINTMENLENNDEDHIIEFQHIEAKAIPGLIDVHIHGANGADVMDGTEEALHTMSKTLPQEGTTSFLATTMTQSEESIGKALQNIASYKDKQPYNEAEILGIHLEGPFINKERKGAQPEEHIKAPNIKLFEKWNKLAKNYIKLVTLAPEVEGGLELTKHLATKGIIASAGHTDATAEDISIAIDHGLSHITHLYNQMRGFHHREPGVVGSAWTQNKLIVELIADGIHSAPDAVKTAYHLKGKDNLLLITDAMRAKCLQDGEYDLGGQKVFVNNQKATLQDGTLAGSTLKLGNALKNMMEFSECSLEDAIMMGSSNAAKELGVDNRKGAIGIGKDADIVLLDENNDILLTICRGEIVYERKHSNETYSN